MPSYFLAYHHGKMPASRGEGAEGMARFKAWIGGLGDAVVNDEFDGQPVVVFSQIRGPNGNGFLRTVGERVLTFTQSGNVITDVETGSTWDFIGRATAGDLQGETLELITARRAFWFSLAFAVPGIDLWEAG